MKEAAVRPLKLGASGHFHGINPSVIFFCSMWPSNRCGVLAGLAMYY